MTEASHEFKVSAEELGFLRAIVADYPDTPGLLEALRGLRLRLTISQSEELRDCLTDRLARIGFDENHAPNADGRLLEDLIDRFFVP